MEAELLQKALDTGAALSEPKKLSGSVPYVVIPEGYQLESLEKQLDFPAHVRQQVTVFDAKSFTDYFNGYCSQDSRVFIDTKRAQILGAIDYHQTGGQAEWTNHRVNLQFRHTAEWHTWISKDRWDFSQIDFARFIEDNLPDIIAPHPATMIEVSRTLEAKKNVNFSQAIRLANNEIQFLYEEEIKGTAAKGTIEVPETFELSIAPFEGSEHYRVIARFRYRFGQEGLKLRYELVRPHKIIEDAIHAIVLQVQQGISNPITYGALG